MAGSRGRSGLRVYNRHGGRPALLQADGQFLSLAWLAAHLVAVHHSDVNHASHDRAAGTWVAAAEDTIQLRIS